jgi:predicted DNA-binding antitoxin AbrB/MazE fold protein
MMNQTITAVYENGVLRPLTPLDLPNWACVRVQIETSPPGVAPPDAERVDEPVFALIGAFSSEKPLIDDIPASEDPDLYLLAEALGDEAQQKHAWEIAPQRYRQGEDGRPVRIHAPTK